MFLFIQQAPFHGEQRPHRLGVPGTRGKVEGHKEANPGSKRVYRRPRFEQQLYHFGVSRGAARSVQRQESVAAERLRVSSCFQERPRDRDGEARGGFAGYNGQRRTAVRQPVLVRVSIRRQELVMWGSGSA